MANEVELKFDVEPGGMERVRSAPILAGPPAAETSLETVYFDTKKGELREAGYSLRVRRSGDSFVQTVKRKRANSAGLFVRQEWEADVEGFAPDVRALRRTPLRSLLQRVSVEALVPLITAQVRRASWQIERKGSCVEIVLDEGEIRNGTARTPICEVELEIQSGKPARLFELAVELGHAVPLRLGTLTKSERGYALAEGRLGRAAKAEAISIDASMSEGEAFRAVAFACLRHYRLNEIVLLAGRESEAVHQARIALRRLRSALSLFRHTVSGSEYQALREDLRWLARQLGDARDADVMLAGDSVGDDEVLRARLLDRREKAYRKVERALHALRTRDLMLRLALWIELGSWRFRARSARPVGPLAAQQMERQWRKIRRHAPRIADGSDRQRHRLRLDVKKLRYAAEFLAGLHRKRPAVVRRERFVTALRDLQDRLGELVDAEAAEEAAARLAPEAAPTTERLRRRAVAADTVEAAQEAFGRAAAAAGYWTPQPQPSQS